MLEDNMKKSVYTCITESLFHTPETNTVYKSTTLQ